MSDKAKALVPTTAYAPAMTVDEVMTIGKVFADSHYFADANSVAQAVVKIQAGRELGFGPMASMTGVHVIEGKPSVGAHLMAAMIKRSGRYDYKVIHLDRERCELAFLELNGSKWESAGPNITFTMEEAKSSGLAMGKSGIKSNWARTPDDMMFARCISKGYRRYCPDLSCGLLIYTQEEMEDGRDDVASQAAPARPAVVVEATPAQPAGMPANQTLHEALAEEQAKGSQPAPAVIDDRQYAEIVMLVQETGTDLNAILKHYQIPVLKKLPAEHHAAVRNRLLEKKSSMPPPAAPAQPPGDDPAKVKALQDEIDQLAFEKLKIDVGQFKETCRKIFGTDNVATLKLPQLTDLRDRLANKVGAAA